jgi:hypothetical protein
MTDTTTQTDAQARADDRARVGIDGDGAAVEHRAVASASTPIRNRRATVDESVPRAATRGIYLDTANVRRVVGAGQPIPDGWTRVEPATVEDRSTDNARAIHAGGKAPASTAKAPTLKDLQERAGELGIEGRSAMNKNDLKAAIADAEAKAAGDGA